MPPEPKMDAAGDGDVRQSQESGDPIGDAIRSSAPAPRMTTVNVTIATTGRLCRIAVPSDMTDLEMGEFTGWLWTQLMPRLKVQQRPASRLVLPT